jgi:hypothetical protein
MSEQAKRPVANKPGKKTATEGKPTTELVPVPFRSGHLLATQDNAGIWVSIKRMCEDIGLDYWTQLRKLKEAAWAVVVMMPTTGTDGKTYQMAMLRADCVAKWMADLNPKKVDPALRPAIEEYQSKARDVLAAYFTPEAARAAGVDTAAIEKRFADQESAYKAQLAQSEERVTRLLSSKFDELKDAVFKREAVRDTAEQTTLFGARDASERKQQWMRVTREAIEPHRTKLVEKFNGSSDAAVEMAVANLRGWLKKAAVGDTRSFADIPPSRDSFMVNKIAEIALEAVNYVLDKNKIPRSYTDKARAHERGRLS